MPLTISRIGQARGRPVVQGFGKCGAITRHSASVRSVWYRVTGRLALHLVASHNTPRAFVEHRRSPFHMSPKNPVARMIATKTVVHIPDAAASEAYTERDPAAVA